MEDKEYQALEKKFHQLQEQHLRTISGEHQVPYGTPAAICQAIVEKLGLEKGKLALEYFATENSVELTTSAYFDAEDLDKGALPIPVKFIDIPDLYAPGQDVECLLEVDGDFVPNVVRRDWIGLFEVGWKYLHSYLTFEWVSDIKKVDDKYLMKVAFRARTLPAKPKDEGHVLCYVTRTGDVLGVSSPFHFKNPGISFTDPDTFLVEDDMLTSINHINIDMPSMSNAAIEVETPLQSGDAGTESSEHMSYDELTLAHEGLRNDHEILSIKVISLERELCDAKNDLAEKDSHIFTLENKVVELRSDIDAKLKHGEEVENERYESLRMIEKELMSARIEQQNLQSLNKDLENTVATFAETIAKQELEMSKTRQQLSDSESIVDSLQNQILQTTNSIESDVLEKCQQLAIEKLSLEQALEQSVTDKATIENTKKQYLEEVNKLKMLIKSKDDVINKLVANKRETDGALVSLRSEAGQHKDEVKRLVEDLNSCAKSLKKSETQCYDQDKTTRKLQNDVASLPQLRTENTNFRNQIVRLEQRSKDLESVKVSLMDEQIATGVVLSLRARIAHLEHLISQLESKKPEVVRVVEKPLPADTELTEELLRLGEENRRLNEKLELSEQEIANITKRAEDIEINFREGIKDLRKDLVKGKLLVEQKNEQLADKGEIIDGLRSECQERREGERFTKHRIAQLEKKISEESESYTQIIRDLQSQLAGYTNAHIQYDRNNLIKCPFCPAAYEHSMQTQMEQHVHQKHPFNS